MRVGNLVRLVARNLVDLWLVSMNTIEMGRNTYPVQIRKTLAEYLHRPEHVGLFDNQRGREANATEP